MRDDAYSRQRLAPAVRPLFGEVLVREFGLSRPCLEKALEEQRLRGGRLGELLRRAGAIGPEVIPQVLAVQARAVADAETKAGGPAFPVRTFLSVCLPAYNEAENIAGVLESACAILPAFVTHFEVVVVDDGSTDATAAIVKELAADHPEVRIVSHACNGGYGAAVGTGLQSAAGELVSFLDADGQFSLLDLPAFLAGVESCDAVIGYRYRRADSARRLLMAWTWNRLLRRLLGIRVRDVDCAFKVFRRDLLDRLRLTASSPGINAEILIQCTRLGARVGETPVQHFPRYHGVPAGAGWRMILRSLRELPHLVRYRFAAFPPADERAATPAPSPLPQALNGARPLPERGTP